jgi:2-phospho-L-lactate guanylyltransferase
MVPADAPRWQALLPVRDGTGKSRLGTGEDPTEFFARDAITAARGCTLIASITVVGRSLPDADRVVRDPGEGLNAAIAAGLAALDRELPVIVMLADLPTLRSEDLSRVIGAFSGDLAIVSDHHGTGTTMALAATPDFAPLFGPDSAAKFTANGFRQIDAPDTARLDVDTADDLNRALRLGIGVATAAWWKRNGAASYTYCRLG